MPRAVVGVWLTTLIWVVVAGGLWARYDFQVEHGREISLRAIPVDPRDLLRGDYVTLRYGISSIDNEPGQDTPWPFLVDGVVFVSIEQEDGDWTVRDVVESRPEDGLFLRGTVRRADGRILEIDYGIESFFVPEGEGLEYEQARNRNRLWAVVSVSERGVTRLKRLEIRGEEERL